jgi:tetratricopeptide (TPR) repeat protein
VRHAGRLVEAARHLRNFLSIIKELEAERRDDEDDDEEDRNDDDDEDDEEERELELVTPEAQVQAHVTLAEIYLELDAARKKKSDDGETAPGEAGDEPADSKDEDYDYEKAAERELRTLLDLLPDQCSPYVHLGAFLRRAGRLEEALEVLEDGRPHIGEMRPDMRLVRELGLTQRAMGDAKAATLSLKAVVEYSAMLDDYNFDPTAAEPLAELWEEQGDLERAADLYRHLAAGTNTAGHYAYNFAAGRLLLAGDKHDLARKYLARAQELAITDEQRAAVEELLAKLVA